MSMPFDFGNLGNLGNLMGGLQQQVEKMKETHEIPEWKESQEVDSFASSLAVTTKLCRSQSLKRPMKIASSSRILSARRPTKPYGK